MEAGRLKDRGSILGRSERFISPPKTSIPALGPTFYTRLKRPGRKGNHALRSTSDVKDSPSSVKAYWGVQVQVKSKGLPRQGEVAQGVPGSLRPRILLTFRHYKGGRSSAKRTGRLYPRRNPWYSHSEAESNPGHMVPSVGATGRNPQ